jgi:GNAT superfamily N-acetyltransferase
MLKLCGSAPEMKALLPGGWQLLDPAAMMVRSDDDTCPVPPGYHANISNENSINTVRLFARDGTLAASGHAVEDFGVYCYDRIVTEEPHRRRGLGRVVMQRLFELRRYRDSQQILTATQMGQQLYAATGWSLYSPFTTAHISD